MHLLIRVGVRNYFLLTVGISFRAQRNSSSRDFGKSPNKNSRTIWSCGEVGRTSPCQAQRCGFKSRRVLHSPPWERDAPELSLPLFLGVFSCLRYWECGPVPCDVMALCSSSSAAHKMPKLVYPLSPKRIGASGTHVPVTTDVALKEALCDAIRQCSAPLGGNRRE